MSSKSYSRLVAIVGRANVGKSSLFNKLIRKRQSLVFDIPGVTRDRIFGLVNDGGQKFFVCDTGGFEAKATGMQAKLTEQSIAAIKEAHVIIFVVDGKDGVLEGDKTLLRLIRKHKKKVVLCVNKIDNSKQYELLNEFFTLGVPDMFPVSAEHSTGISDLMESVTTALDEICPHTLDVEDDQINLALIGRPNVGKSSILNRMTGEERSIVDDKPGTTRDVVDSFLTSHGHNFRLLDTAGIRKKSRVADKLEMLSSMRSLSCIAESNITVLVISAEDGVTEGDARVAGYAFELNKPILIVINKWDLIKDKNSKTSIEFEKKVLMDLRYVSYAKVIFVSAEENLRVSKILPLCIELYEQSKQRIPTAQVNAFLKDMLLQFTPPLVKNRSRRIKFFYATQIGVLPPKFLFFCSDPDELHFSYKRYVENSLRERFGFKNIPIALVFRKNNEKKDE